MSIIENPVAKMNDVDKEKTNAPVPLPPPRKKRSQEILDETPLTSNMEGKRSPRSLGEPVEDKGDPPDNLSDNQSDTSEAVSEDRTLDRVSEDEEEEGEKEETEKEEGVSQEAILAAASVMNSEDEDDADFDPEKVPADKGDGDGGGDVKRQYTLRHGTKGTKGTEESAKIVEHTDEDKKKTDDLWEAFKADVAKPLKRKAKEIEANIKEKTYDFAGEAVTVREEVKNKRKSMVSSFGLDRKRRRESAPLTTLPSDATTVSDEKAETSGPSVKRFRPVSKLNSIVGKLAKKPKMSVFNKTALDWDTYKSERGIKDDVENEAKSEGYLEKQDFLARTDQRQFELEKEIRLQQQRRRHMMGSKQ